MEKLLNSIEKVFTFVAAMACFALMLLTTLDTVGRYILNRPITGAFEISTNYLLVALAFLPMAYSYCEGAHVRVDFLAARLPKQVKLLVNHLVQVVSIMYILVLVVASTQQALRVLSSHTVMSSLEIIPMWPASLIVPVGLFSMFLLMLLDLGRVRKGRSRMFKEESAEEAPTV
jgi:TRAP-type C4-dicarboxylate transport system permease small subunit